MPPLPKNKSQTHKKRHRTAAPQEKEKKGKLPAKEKLGFPTSAPSTPTIPVDLQQLLLNIFRDAFRPRLDSDIKPLLQEVKQHLFNREFSAAFSKEEYLEAYAARWSPSRALNYLSIFQTLKSELRPFSDEGNRKSWKVVNLGGGAGAEIVALGGFAKMMGIGDGSSQTDDEAEKGEEVEPHEALEKETPPTVDILTIDIANWSPILDLLSTHITTAPHLSPYASAAIKAANKPLLPSPSLTHTFQQADILSMPATALQAAVQDAHLVTIMFTLNELYTASVAKTQSFLMRLTEYIPKGALLLVVDSPGSYSAVSLNGKEKEYPMRWLIDFTLLGRDGGIGDDDDDVEGKGWVKVVEEESRWFRLGEGLRYPIELENGRVQLHLYRRT